MAELKDIVDLDSNEVVLKDNRVTGSLLPKKNAELGRNVTINGNVSIEGALYAETLEVKMGPAVLKGAVFANNEVHLNMDCKGLIHFEKSVASPKSVAAMLTSGAAIFGGDINAPSIKLKNCFVCGSVYGTEVFLENSVVLGGVFATKTLSINTSTLGTFNAPEVSAGGINYLLYPTAFSVEPMSILPGTEFWNLCLADLGSLYKGETEKDNTGKIRMDLTHDTQRTILVDKEGTKTLVNSYSVATRVLVSDLIDLDKFENHFLIISASLGSQALKQYSLTLANGEKGPELTVSKIAEFFFGILSGKTAIKEISGQVDFDELKQLKI